MRSLALATVFLAFMPMVLALSPPYFVEVVLIGSPSRIDSDNMRYLAVAFSDRSALGFFDVVGNSYFEFPLKQRVLKTVFIGGFAVALLSSGEEVAVIDIQQKTTKYFALGSRADGIASNDDGVYVYYRLNGKVSQISLENGDEISSFSVEAAEGLDLFSASGSNICLVSSDLKGLLSIRRGVQQKVDVQGFVTKIQALNDGCWVVLNDDKVLKIVNGRIVQTTQLPRATFVSSLTALGDRLVYVSVSRRVIGIVDETGYRERNLIENPPGTVAVTGTRLIWFLDTASRRLGYVIDSRPPSLYDSSFKKLDNGVVEVRTKVSDPDGDVEEVKLIVVEHQGIYVLNRAEVSMGVVDGFYFGLYRPSANITKAELFLNATDSAGNSVSQKIGEVDYTKQTTPVIITETTSPTVPAGTPFVIASELLLLIPLLVIVSFLLIGRRGRRKTRKKR